jgi:hypothetical protein
MGIGLYRGFGIEVGSSAVIFMVVQWQWVCQTDVNYNRS